MEDWPKKNYRICGMRGKEPRFQFFTWDSESAFFEHWKSPRNPGGGSALEFEQFRDSEFLGDERGPGFLFRKLIEVPEFKQKFTARANELLKGEGVLSPGAASSRYRVLLDEVEPLLIRESERWGTNVNPSGEPYGPRSENWEKLTGPESWLFREFFPQRSADLIGDLTRHGFYGE